MYCTPFTARTVDRLGFYAEIHNHIIINVTMEKDSTRYTGISGLSAFIQHNLQQNIQYIDLTRFRNSDPSTS